MKIFRISTYSGNGGQAGPSIGRSGFLLRFLLALCLMVAFILLFCLRGCSDRGRNPLGPEREIVTQDGDTLRGQNPQLMNPSERRDADRTGRTGGGYRPDDDRKVGWPVGLEEGERNPALPPRDSNRMSPVRPEDRTSDPETGKDIDGAHLFVILDSDSGDETFNFFATKLSSVYAADVCSIEYYNTLSKTLLLRVAPADRETVKRELPSKIPELSFYVVYVEMLTLEYHPNDPAFSYEECSWQFEAVQAFDAWDITRGDPNVTVAVIDSYFDLFHPDLDDVRVVCPYSVERGTNNVLPKPELINQDVGSYLHGTHVAGIVFAEMNNIEGSSGMAPGCSFMPVSLGRILTDYALIEGILYAIYKGAAVINLSIGSSYNPDFVRRATLRDQVEIAANFGKEKEHLWDYVFHLCEERNVTIVWASGNQNVLSAMDASKRNAGTVRVDAVDRTLHKADYSNWGILTDYGIDNSTVSAPGSGIVSTIPGGDYLPLDGTSMAAPIVTGAVALMKSVSRNLTNSEIIEILRETSKSTGDRNISGLVQIHDALLKVKDDFLRFDDVMSNHENLVGKWEATSAFLVTKNDEETGETAKLEMTFTSASNGTVDLTYISGDRLGCVCSAPLRVSWGTDDFTIQDTDYPSDGGENKFSRSVYHCSPDGNGLLRVSCRQGDGSTSVDFYLRKI